MYDQEIAALASKVAAENKLKAQQRDVAGGAGQASDSAEAFTDEAGQLEQAREQQKEFVQEGTGSEQVSDSDGQAEQQASEGHIQGEL